MSNGLLPVRMNQVCERCGAVYSAEEAAVVSWRCTIAREGGGICEGRLLAAAQVPDAGSSLPRTVVYSPHEIDTLLKTVEFRRGVGTLPDGCATAIITFKNAEDRSLFAELVIRAGGKVGR